MQPVDERVVREFFEQYGFLTMALRKSRSHTRRPSKDEGIDLFVRNPNFAPGGRKPSFLLFASELRYLESAVVCVRGWHHDKASLASMQGGAEILKHVETQVLKQVEKWFSFDAKSQQGLLRSASKVLVAPVFPTQEPYRAQCAAALREKGVDGILSFRSILLDLIDRVDVRQVYEKSDLLQLIRTLKVFDLIKDSQMNFLS